MTSEEAGSGVVTLDGDAADVINSMLRDQGFDPETAGVRISVERGGCAGLAYRFDLAAAPDPEDVVCETDRASVFVDRPSKQYLDGAELSVEHTAHGTGFCIDNPNADQECGCGLSFQ